MFTLLSGLLRWFLHKDEYYVLILGLNDAGKSTFLEHAQKLFTAKGGALQDEIVQQQLKKITATVGLNVGEIVTHGTKLKFWDLGGQRDLQLLWDKYYQESHAIIYVVSGADRDSFEESKLAFDAMISNEHLAGVPLLLVANKQDIDDAAGVLEVTDAFHCFASKLGARDSHVIGVSALRGDNVMPAVEWVAEKVKRNHANRPPNVPDDI